MSSCWCTLCTSTLEARRRPRSYSHLSRRYQRPMEISASGLQSASLAVRNTKRLPRLRAEHADLADQAAGAAAVVDIGIGATQCRHQSGPARMHEAQHRQACSECIGFEGLDAFPDCAVGLAVIERRPSTRDNRGGRGPSQEECAAGARRRHRSGRPQGRAPPGSKTRRNRCSGGAPRALRRGAVESSFGGAQDG